MQELVRTGRPSGRHGGGEAEIPTWFEAAARKMLEDRSSVSDGISLAELTLVAAAPSHQVAASSRGSGGGGGGGAPAGAPSKQAAAAGPVDIEQLARDVYQQIIEFMGDARSRNGEYL
ncbi:MAG: hypothetical protein H0T79_07235 [Deltaproteobacteria bacterium]|nr:hypothetical protein [Deltaproteobacteria bacterium]